MRSSAGAGRPDRAAVACFGTSLANGYIDSGTEPLLPGRMVCRALKHGVPQ